MNVKRPQRKRAIKRKSGFRKAVNRKRKSSSTTVSKQHAISIESYEVEDLQAGTSYSSPLDMSYFPRSQQIGMNYQEYKISNLEFLFEPLYNTFQEASTGTGAVTIPQMLWYLDRVGQSTSWSKAQLEAMGVKPRKFTSNMKFHYKPNTLVLTQNNVGLPQPALNGQIQTPSNTVWLPAQSSQVQMNKWFSTQYDCGGAPGAILFQPTAWWGCHFYIDQDINDAPQVVGRLTVRATIEFRGPNITINPVSATPALSLKPKVVTPVASVAPVL